MVSDLRFYQLVERVERLFNPAFTWSQVVTARSFHKRTSGYRPVT